MGDITKTPCSRAVPRLVTGARPRRRRLSEALGEAAEFATPDLYTAVDQPVVGCCPTSSTRNWSPLWIKNRKGGSKWNLADGNVGQVPEDVSEGI